MTVNKDKKTNGNLFKNYFDIHHVKEYITIHIILFRAVWEFINKLIIFKNNNMFLNIKTVKFY